MAGVELCALHTLSPPRWQVVLTLFSSTDKGNRLGSICVVTKTMELPMCVGRPGRGPNLVLSSTPAFDSWEVRKGDNSKTTPTLSSWGTGGMVIPPPKQGKGKEAFRLLEKAGLLQVI